MKLLIASDIHGSAESLSKIMEAYADEKAERMVLLGDLLYHGPRNDLPKGYAPKEVISILNSYKNELLCVRGNCEAEVDQMVLEFPVMAEYMLMYLDGIMVFATHGHIYNLDNLPPLKSNDILLHGHTHIPAMIKKDSIWYLNPGSVSIPKSSSFGTYMVYEDGVYTIKTLDGQIKSELDITSGTVKAVKGSENIVLL